MLLATCFSALGSFGVPARAAPDSPDVSPVPLQAAADAGVARPQPHDIRREIPLLSYTTSAFGAPRLTMGGLGYGGLLGASGSAGVRSGGGGRIWASPIDRLTLLVEVAKSLDDKKAAANPSLSAMVRLFGGTKQGYAVGAGMTYQTEGFAELGGELEGSLLFSLARGRFHADTNVTFGGAVEEETEADGEVKLRVGYDVTSWCRLGLDGRFRYRLAGATSLPGDRLGDALGGPEVLFSYEHFFFAVQGGPSTVGVARGLGGTVVGTFGAAVW